VERAQEIADEVQDIVDTAAAEVKGEAESWAIGKRDGQDVPSTDPAYHNNAKYYAQQAQDIADSIGIDATLSISGKAADAKKTGDEISSLKEDLNNVSENLDDETARAQAEEARIEALFTQPVEDAVSDWLDDHPEATTTVQDGSLTDAKFSDALKLKTIKDYVTPQMFGAKGDGLTDDTLAFNEALASGKPVYAPIGTYLISSVLKVPFSGVLRGADRYKTILKFANGVNGVQINRFTNVEDLTISISGDSAGIYMYVPENWQYNLCSLCKNISIEHRSNTIDGNGILLVTEAGQTIEGAFNLTFENIDINGVIENGIHMQANVKTTVRNEAWLSDIKFDNIFVVSAKIAILSDWVDISGTDNVPQTGNASRFYSITFRNVSAQYKAGVSERFCKIMNIYYGSFVNCTPFDYYLTVSANIAPYLFNGTNEMCLLDLGFMPEITFDLTQWFEFENQTNFDANFSKVVRFLNTPNANKSYGNFYNHVTTLSGTDVLTLTDTTNSSIVSASASVCGNIVQATFEIRMESISEGSNDIGRLKISPNSSIIQAVSFGRSADAGAMIRLLVNTNGYITAVASSARADFATIRATLTYIRKYYLYG
jgi:hypothetical protein